MERALEIKDGTNFRYTEDLLSEISLRIDFQLISFLWVNKRGIIRRGKRESIGSMSVK